MGAVAMRATAARAGTTKENNFIRIRIVSSLFLEREQAKERPPVAAATLKFE
jgi:hypothetical protein